MALSGVVIVPGGSYNKIMERDSERVAITLATHAFQAFVVRYPVLEHKGYRAAKRALAQTFDYLVDHAAELDLDPQRLGVLGFSAGGQLAAAYSNQPATKAKFVGLGYPVIRPLIDQRMGVTTEDVSQLVTKQTPATFMWGSIQDQLTPYLDHLAVYAQALAKQGFPLSCMSLVRAVTGSRWQISTPVSLTTTGPMNTWLSGSHCSWTGCNS